MLFGLENRMPAGQAANCVRKILRGLSNAPQQQKHSEAGGIF